MHKLSRSVRFSVNPFLPQDAEGSNSYASRPAGEGLAIFFELCVELSGEIEPSTGFVVNVTDIDRKVREVVVPIFSQRLRDSFGAGRHIGFRSIMELLRASYRELADKFGPAKVSGINLKLNPFRKVGIVCEGATEALKMLYFSEKFEFAATHKLWNDDFSEERNFKVFGKCASKAGHGHNYIVEVTVKTDTNGDNFCAGDFERTVNDELIELIDHKNLNIEVAEFGDVNPTVENLAVFAWERLVDRFGPARLHCVTVWETDKTCCSYYG